jgi:hypothetical protein
MAVRAPLLVVCLGLAIAAAGCRTSQHAPPAKPDAAIVAPLLPQGATVIEIDQADVTGDGHDEVLVAALDTTGGGKRPLAVILTHKDRGFAPSFQRRMVGESWDPIQMGKTGDEVPLAVVFSTRTGGAGAFNYIVVQQVADVTQVTLERSGLFAGSIRFLNHGLLESRGDVDRVYRWSESGWQPEDLGSQYQPPLPAETITIAYSVNTVRGPVIDGPREVRARVGQHIFLYRTDTGEPSRILFTGTPSAYSVTPDGLISLLQPDVIEIHIESPAYSGREMIISVRIDPK